MSSPSATADATLKMPGARGGGRNLIAALTPANYIDSGQPVLDLPPLIEPEFEPPEFEPPKFELAGGHRPARRSFLAPVAPVVEPAPAGIIAALDIPELIEPVFAPAESAPFMGPAPAPPVAAPARWLASAGALLPAASRSRYVAVGSVVAIGLIAVSVELLGFGPFARARHYPVSAAPTDVALRLAYYQEGAQAGDANAELELAILYAKGTGVAQDYATAGTWFRAAANQGVARAQYDLGVLYERGRGVKTDLTEAANWYLKAAQAGYPLAEYNLAVCYTKGQGIRQDLPEAALWYHRAALQGVVQAMITLGAMYEKGEGVAASPVDAYTWYLVAGRRNNQAAARRAEDLFNGLPRLDQIRAEALASDVAASIHDAGPEAGEAVTGSADAKSAAPTH